jgi:acyl carrier protein
LSRTGLSLQTVEYQDNAMTLSEQIKDVFMRELAIPVDEFSSDLRYGDAAEWDSTTHMIIVLALEERFTVGFDSEEIPTLTSVQAIEDALRRKGVVDA